MDKLCCAASKQTYITSSCLVDMEMSAQEIEILSGAMHDQLHIIKFWFPLLVTENSNFVYRKAKHMWFLSGMWFFESWRPKPLGLANLMNNKGETGIMDPQAYPVPRFKTESNRTSGSHTTPSLPPHPVLRFRTAFFPRVFQLARTQTWA